MVVRDCSTRCVMSELSNFGMLTKLGWIATTRRFRMRVSESPWGVRPMIDQIRGM